MKTKRTLSGLLAVLLCLTMLGGMVPVVASAETQTIVQGHCSDHDTSHTGWTPLNENYTTYKDFNGGKYVLEKNITFSGNFLDFNNAHICLNGHSITLAAGSNLRFYSGNISLCDCSGKGKIERIADSAVVFAMIRAGCTLNMYGGQITGNNMKSVAGLRVEGVFNMYNGLISNIKSTVAQGGAAVYVTTGGAFTMYGGEISGNETTNTWGGGVITTYTGNRAEVPENTKTTVTIKGGTITGNTAPNGAAFGMINDATLTIEGGNITGNTASRNGGAIYMMCQGDQYDAPSVNITGGNITQNRASNGGAIHAAAGSVTVDGANINQNTATSGGGIYAAGADITVKSGALSGNTATENGGGFYVKQANVDLSKPAPVQIKGGTMTQNTGKNGGAMYIEAGYVAVSGGEITNNQNPDGYNNGGGIYMGGGTLDITGGTLKGNKIDDIRSVNSARINISGSPYIAHMRPFYFSDASNANKATVNISNLKNNAYIKTLVWTAEGVEAPGGTNYEAAYTYDETASREINGVYGVYTYNQAAAIVARMVLGNNLNIQFAIPAELIAGGVWINGEPAESIGTVEGGEYDGYGIFKCYVKATDMTKPFEIAVQKDSKTYTKTDSVQAYAMRMLEGENSAVLDALLVDMLNYGTEAKKLYGSGYAGNANDGLSAEQKNAFAGVTAQDVAGKASLVLSDNLDIQIAVNEACAGKTLRYTFTPFDGDAALIYSAAVQHDATYGIYYVRVNQIVFADYAAEITVMDGQTEVAKDSVQSYVGRRIQAGENDVDLAKALLKFAQSACAYLSN